MQEHATETSPLVYARAAGALSLAIIVREAPEARQAIAGIRELCARDAAPPDANVVAVALGIRKSRQLKRWDCLLQHRRTGAGCRYRLSEDMWHGPTIRHVSIRDPFQSDLAGVVH